MKRIIFLSLIFTLIISGCNAPVQESVPVLEITDTSAQKSNEIEKDESPLEIPADEPFLIANLPIDVRVDDLLSRMTLDEKIGQITQAENVSITPSKI